MTILKCQHEHAEERETVLLQQTLIHLLEDDFDDPEPIIIEAVENVRPSRLRDFLIDLHRLGEQLEEASIAFASVRSFGEDDPQAGSA